MYHVLHVEMPGLFTITSKERKGQAREDSTQGRGSASLVVSWIEGGRGGEKVEVEGLVV